jgi:hypothetical protein
LRQDLVKYLTETIAIGRTVHHKLREDLARIQEQQPRIRDGAVDVEAFQALHDRRPMLRSGDHNEPITRFEAGAQESPHQVEEARLVLVEVHQVMTTGRSLEKRCCDLALDATEGDDVRHRDPHKTPRQKI